MTALKCANHPDIETHLRCSRCGKPICVRCTVQTPVGGRCRECADVRKSPVFDVRPRLYVTATLYGLGAALGGGLIWGQVGSLFGQMGGLFGISSLLMLLLGYVVGEAVSRGAGGRISRGLVVMAGAFTVLAAIVGRASLVLISLPQGLPLGMRLEAALGFAVGDLLGNLFGLLFLVLAAVIATSRVR